MIKAVLYAFPAAAVLALLASRLAAPAPGPPSAEALYARNCEICHGPQGRGDGRAARLLDPRPRDFRLGQFRLVSTQNGVPAPADIERTIRNGIAGTSMGCFLHLNDGEIQALAALVLSFAAEGWRERLSKRGLAGKKLDQAVKVKTAPGAPIAVPPEPPRAVEGTDRGRALFAEHCARCHGEDGRGKTDPAWKTAEGFPIRSRDFRSGVFKGGGAGPEIFRRVYAGLPGTPMPAFSSLAMDDLWRVAQYVRSLRGTP